jgi:hypothetical protein
MSSITILIVILLVVLFSGGGFYWSRRGLQRLRASRHAPALLGQRMSAHHQAGCTDR